VFVKKKIKQSDEHVRVLYNYRSQDGDSETSGYI